MLSKLNFASPLTQVPGIGQSYIGKLESIGIATVQDLLYYFPFRYEDLSETKKIADLAVGETITLTATVWQITKIRTRAGRSLIKAVLVDQTGRIEAAWFNQDYLLSVLKPNQVLNFSGKVNTFGNKLSLLNPKYESLKLSGDQVHTGRLVPIYSESGGLTTTWLRAKIHQLLQLSELQTEELIPETIRQTEKLSLRHEALSEIHFPSSFEKLVAAQNYLAFEELFFLQLRNLQNEPKQNKVINSWKIKKDSLVEFESCLPFKLTNSQRKTIEEISNDLQSGKILNRLLQGEVGSGKTVVSAFALVQAVKNGYKSALMAPTGILAGQHFQTLSKILGDKYKIALATSSQKLKDTNFDIAVGTHALLYSQNLDKLGLVVVDEQQRFGVAHRQLLREKGRQTHFLTMTATPIPRTLALTIYGNLDISTLDELPTGPKQVKTYLVPRIKRASSYEFVKKEILAGGQVFIVCPLINLSESLQSVKSATSEFEMLKKDVFPQFKMGLLHGKLNTKEKDEIITEFRDRKISILVATPVVEVGIDIQGANVIMIEAADRFGLSSLHQLRGRVGRAGQKSFCLLFTDSSSPKVLERLKLLERHNSGLDLAEIDLKLRGPGDIFGTMQHGQFELKTAEFINLNIAQRSREVAHEVWKKGINKTLEKSLNEFLPTTKIFSKD